MIVADRIFSLRLERVCSQLLRRFEALVLAVRAQQGGILTKCAPVGGRLLEHPLGVQDAHLVAQRDLGLGAPPREQVRRTERDEYEYDLYRTGLDLDADVRPN